VQQLAAKAPAKQKGRKQRKQQQRRMGGSRMWVLLGLGGVIAVAVLVWRRRAADRLTEPAPDAFGAAVEQERSLQGAGFKNYATPGA
jgi:hypothetical protein